MPHFLVRTENTDSVEYLVEAKTQTDAGDAVETGEQREELPSAWVDGDFTVTSIRRLTPETLAEWQKKNPFQPAVAKVGGCYGLMIEDDGCSIETIGPFADDAARVKEVKRLLKEPNRGENRRELYRLDIDDQGRPTVETIHDEDGFLLADTIDDEDEDDEEEDEEEGENSEAGC